MKKKDGNLKMCILKDRLVECNDRKSYMKKLRLFEKEKEWKHEWIVCVKMSLFEKKVKIKEKRCMINIRLFEKRKKKWKKIERGNGETIEINEKR